MDAVAWREVGPCLRDPDDGLAGLQLFARQAEVHVALDIERGHAGIEGIVEPASAAKCFPGHEHSSQVAALNLASGCITGKAPQYVVELGYSGLAEMPAGNAANQLSVHAPENPCNADGVPIDDARNTDLPQRRCARCRSQAEAPRRCQDRDHYGMAAHPDRSEDRGRGRRAQLSGALHRQVDELSRAGLTRHGGDAQRPRASARRNLRNRAESRCTLSVTRACQ